MTIHNFKVIYLTLFLYSFPISPSTLLGTMRHVHGFKGYTYPPTTPATSRNHSCTCLLILRPGGCLDIFHEWNYRLACCVGPKSSRWWSLLEAGFPLSGQHKSQQFIFTVRCTRTITPPLLRQPLLSWTFWHAGTEPCAESSCVSPCLVCVCV